MSKKELAATEKPKRINMMVDMDIPLTAMELTFLEILVEGKVKPHKAVKLAGYPPRSEMQYRRIAKNIVKKYESSGQGAPNVYRDHGCGEFTVVGEVKKLALSKKPSVLKFRALELAAKSLGMLEQQGQTQAGVTVIIQALDSPTQVNIQPAPAQPQEQSGYQHPKPLRPGKPIQITD
jgi:hypothetical protein